MLQNMYSRQPKYEFMLMVIPTEENKDDASFKTQMRRYVNFHNQQSNRIEIEKFIMVEENNVDTKQHMVWIQLNKSKAAADQNYFNQQSHLGCKVLNQFRWKVTQKSIKNPRVQLINYIDTNCGTLIQGYDDDPEYFQIPNWVNNRLADEDRKLNFAAIDDVGKKFTEDDAGRDFTTKLVNGEVTSLQDYYQKAQDVSHHLSFRVAKYSRSLKSVQELEKGKKLELPDLPTMMETLNEYINKYEIPKLNSVDELMALIGDRNSQYYAACYYITQVMLLRMRDKMRCVIIHGTSDSGKSHIAKIMSRIFIAFMMFETRGIYDQQMSELEAHIQLFILNEANLLDLFEKKKMPAFKLFTEGEGRMVENKYGHPFKGFINCHQLITCQHLVCPLVEPLSSRSKWTRFEYLSENEALMKRVKLVRFSKEYSEMDHMFADKEWAQCLLYMAENFENIQPPVEPNVFEVEQLGNDGQNQSQSLFKPPESALIAQANDWKRKFKASEDRNRLQQNQIQLLQAQLNQLRGDQQRSMPPSQQYVTNNINYNIQASQNNIQEVDENMNQYSDLYTQNVQSNRVYSTQQRFSQQIDSTTNNKKNKRLMKVEEKENAERRKNESITNLDNLLKTIGQKALPNKDQPIGQGDPLHNNGLSQQFNQSKIQEALIEFKEPEPLQKRMSQMLEKKEKHIQPLTDSEKVRAAYDQVSDDSYEDFDQFKPKQNEEDIQEDDIANSDDALLLDKHAAKKEKQMLESGYFEDQAGEGGNEEIEEPIDF